MPNARFFFSSKKALVPELLAEPLLQHIREELEVIEESKLEPDSLLTEDLEAPELPDLQERVVDLTLEDGRPMDIGSAQVG